MDTSIIIPGKEVSLIRREALRELVKQEVSQGRRPPGLAVILVGDDPASKVYVSSKEKAATSAGFKTYNEHLSRETTPADLATVIERCNQNPEIDGILLQLPLPSHLKAEEFLMMIDPKKDADGLHPLNQGFLMRGGGVFTPCTPAGSMVLIDVGFEMMEGFPISATPKKKDLSGYSAIVIGRSLLVGKPISFLLQQRNATVTMAHSKTRDLDKVCRQADIVIAAVGVKELVRGEWIKQGAMVIDVGINKGDDGKLYGDVCFDEASLRASAITPVPGGVGPLTIQMLLENTFTGYRTYKK